MNKKYKRNYLDRVILRIDFEEINNSKKIKEYSDKMSKIFPYKEKSCNYVEDGQINFSRKSIKNKKNKIEIWDYLDAYKKKMIRIAPNFLAIEYRDGSYIDSRALINDCKEIVNDFLNYFPISIVNRVGLRYINRFDLDNEVGSSMDWNKYFSRDLVGSINFARKTKLPLSRAMTSLQLKSDDHDILIKYGIWNMNFPSENTRKEFIFDIDAFSRFPLESINGIVDVVKKYNENIEKIFKEGLGLEIKKLLNKKR